MKECKGNCDKEKKKLVKKVVKKVKKKVVKKVKTPSKYHKCAKETGKCKNLKQGVKGYHKCAKANNCKKADRITLDGVDKIKLKGVVSKIKKSTAKATITRGFSKMVKLKKPKPKNTITESKILLNLLRESKRMKITPEDLIEKKWDIEDKRDNTNANFTLRPFGMEDRIIAPEMCKEVVKQVKLLEKFKKNNYKKNTDVPKTKEKLTKYIDGKFRYYKKNELENIIGKLQFFMKDKEQQLIDYFKDCGTREEIFLRLGQEILTKDKKIILEEIKKQRSKQTKDFTLPHW